MAPNAAALPSPPSFAPGDTIDRHNLGVIVPRGGQNDGTGSHQNGFSPRFPNIKDLQDEAAALDVNETTPLSDLLATAQDAIAKFRGFADSDQLDKAYVQYVRASEIAINLIPHHPDYRIAVNRIPGWHKQFADLIMSVRTKQGTVDTIKQQIVDNNLTSHVQPTGQFFPGARRPASQILPAGTYMHADQRGRQNETGDSSTRMPSPSQFQALGSPEQPNRYSAPPDVLAQRLARLKTTSPTTNGASPLSPSSGNNDPLYTENKTPRPSSYISHGPTHGSTLNSPQRRPLGPRIMGTAQGGPSLPPKIPLNTSLPRAPDPAYSPIFTVPSQPPSNPPRTSTENFRPMHPRHSQLASSPHGSQSPNGLNDNPYRSRTPNGIHSVKPVGSNTADLPHKSTVSAQELMAYLQQYHVLLIDVRPREEFDGGHVYAKSIICIEPVVLRENVSAEELEERLVVSPEHEQSLFERRNEFDMVVYYDQSTSSNSYLAGPPIGTSAPHLRALYDTLYEFNAYKPLKDGRPPMLLLGGLDAWIDLQGQQSLGTSSTAAILASIQKKRPVARPGRPLGRVPTTASANSSLEIRKRRLRKLEQLNPDELTEWMEKSRTEEIDTSIYLGEETLTEEPEEDQHGETPVSPFVRSYEDFLRRFPEPNAIQQSMVMAQPEPTVTSNYAAPMPVVPSRPPPAVPRPSYSGVSDGRQIQAPLQRQNSATKTALYTPSSLLNRLKLPRTGLANFGVTCYMNSTIQCLSATVLMSKFFIDDRFRLYVQKNWKGSQGVMPGLFANLIRSLWKNDVQVIMPTSFRNFCGRLNQEWGIDRQQDAKEFFDFVVDCLHEDLNVNWQRTPLRPLTFEEEMQRERMPVAKVSRIEWDRYCHREESFISSLFAGQHASRLRCTTCQRTSTTYEAFYSISVEIPPSGKGDIYQCLRSYCQEEMLSGDEVWKCPYCKCERVASKQIIITRAPQILVVHFKRFSASKTQSARKIHTPIDFPLHGLRMDDFVFTQPNQAAAANAPTGSQDTTLATEPPFTYDAYGVLRHLGSSMGSGHYISLVRDASRQCWRKFDDGRATDFIPRDLSFKDRLQNEQAYIVFYERVPAK
ncbi:hypothetical protein BJY04DRAFT_177488 [Aspergillus karnatakaensis]|uniref:putative ubiquitin C-terminal hydrolase n=1 Tax=Aspergillus karnatakaensis TaxID=1810916 RepID=UPI003CCDDFB6